MRTNDRIITCLAIAALTAGGCRPSDVLSVPPPSGVSSSTTLDNQAGAEGQFTVARFETFNGMVGQYGLLEFSELLTDEFTWSDFSVSFYDSYIDARITTPQVYDASDIDNAWQGVLTGRSSMALAVPLLERYEPASGGPKIGEAFALMGYAELVIGEAFCGGTTLDQVLPNAKGYAWGMPLTTDSLFGVAEAHFDSALAHAHGDATVTALARVGLGRALLDRNRPDSAATAVAAVPTGFVYNTDLPPVYGQGGTNMVNEYAYLFADVGGPADKRWVTVSDREGGTGLDFRSAADPRVVIDSSLGQTNDNTTWYFPAKFEGAGQEYIPLATGVEARLIAAEAALRAGQVGTWAADLNALRADAADTKVTFAPAAQSIPTDSTTGATAAEQIDVMFRERAFWLFGTGVRLGDLRRLIRQYGRAQSAVFPSGPYANGYNPGLPAPIPSYGTDVNLQLPNGTSGDVVTNPNYKGCLDHNA